MQSVIYEIVIRAGGETTQNTILEKAYQYEQKDIIDALVDLQLKKKLFKIGNHDANMQNSGAKIIWFLPKSDENNSDEIEGGTPNDMIRDNYNNIIISEDMDNIQDDTSNITQNSNTKHETNRSDFSNDTSEHADVKYMDAENNDTKQNTSTINDKLSSESLSCLTEQMLLAIWESHIDNDEPESAKRISDEIDSRGFTIRERNGAYHISKQPTKKK